MCKDFCDMYALHGNIHSLETFQDKSSVSSQPGVICEVIRLYDNYK